MASDELVAVSEALRAQGVFTGATFEERRASMEAATGGIPIPDGVAVVPIDAGGVPAERVTAPGAATDRAVLYVHGGAYTAGSLTTHRRHVANLSAACGCQVIALDYRLAPEHPHPAAVDDAVAAYRWLTGPDGVAPERVVIAGDSAGGGLAAAALVALRDLGDPLPAGGALISPWADMTLTAETYRTRADLDPMCSLESLAPSAEAYLGGLDPTTPWASPVHADLAGLPPLCIHVGDHEVLLDDALTLAKRAEAAGVDVELWHVPEMIHVWHAFAGIVPEGQEALERLAAWISARHG
jgi:monoterpene epsilon-lactone hydrolase